MEQANNVKLLIEKFESMSMRKVHIADAPQDWHLSGNSGRVAETIAKFEHNIYPFSMHIIASKSRLLHVRDQLEQEKEEWDEKEENIDKLLNQEMEQDQQLDLISCLDSDEQLPTLTNINSSTCNISTDALIIYTKKEEESTFISGDKKLRSTESCTW